MDVLKRKSIEKKRLISESYGKRPQDQSFDRNLIERDWSISSLQISDQDKVDDTTWFDLEMDQIYCDINHCKSFAGDQILYSIMHITGKSKDTDFERKINFFELNKRNRDEIWYIISGMGKSADNYYLPVYIENLEAFKIPHIEYYRFMRMLLFFSFIPAVVFMDYVYLMFPFFVALINIVIYAFQKNKYESYLNMLEGVLKTINAAKQISKDPSLEYEQNFKDLTDKIIVFQKLYSKIGKLQYRAASNLSGDIFTLMESFTFGITLWDLIQYDKVISHLVKLKKELRELYRLIGEIDAAISVASFRKTLPMFCTPVFSKDDTIKGQRIFHPFIEQPVYNSIEVNKGCIITGSNASGKSTFIKSLAINAVLGQSIYTCMAESFRMPVCSVITSMAVRDEVLSGESYYIKEIKYLNRIIKTLNSEKMVFCVIDEILRGTNTEERIAASCAILKYLCKKKCIAVIATHDIELSVMLGERYSNFHFTELIQNNEIIFEYKLYPGPATSRNAIKLLEIMGFPKEIIEAAEIIVSDIDKIPSQKL